MTETLAENSGGTPEPMRGKLSSGHPPRRPSPPPPPRCVMRRQDHTSVPGAVIGVTSAAQSVTLGKCQKDAPA